MAVISAWLPTSSQISSQPDEQTGRAESLLASAETGIKQSWMELKWPVKEIVVPAWQSSHNKDLLHVKQQAQRRSWFSRNLFLIIRQHISIVRACFSSLSFFLTCIMHLCLFQTSTFKTSNPQCFLLNLRSLKGRCLLVIWHQPWGLLLWVSPPGVTLPLTHSLG